MNDEATRRLYDQLPPTPLESVPPAEHLDSTVVIVPGAFWRTHHNTGADGRLIREEADRLGARTDIIPLPNLGTLQQNATAVRDWLSQSPDEPIILFSLSKGGADIKVALTEPESFRNVVAWVNISGLLDGTPLVGWLFGGTLRSYWTRFLLWVRRYDVAAIRELDRGGPLDFPLKFPDHMLVIHVVGFPRRADLSTAFARRCHRRIAHLGPNDGLGIVLSDVLRWPGLVHPVWGADHYLRPTGRDMRTVARQTLSYLACALPSSIPA